MIRKTKLFALTVSALLANPATAADFQSPSGNIQCYLEQPLKGDLVCLIFNANWPKPALPEPCDLDQTRSVRLSPNGAATTKTICHGDLFWPYPSAKISYGATWSVNEYSCEIAKTGVTCRNQAGRGFALNRAAAKILN